MDNRAHIHTHNDDYFLVEGIFVVPDDSVDVPLIHEDLYKDIKRKCYEDRSVPILFRVEDEDYHFEVHPSTSVPTGTIYMPFEMAQDLDEAPLPSEVQILMATPRQSHNISTNEGGTIEG